MFDSLDVGIKSVKQQINSLVLLASDNFDSFFKVFDVFRVDHSDARLLAYFCEKG